MTDHHFIVYTRSMAHMLSLAGRLAPSRLLHAEAPLVGRELARTGRTRLLFVVRGLMAGYALLGITLFWAARSYLHVAPQEFLGFLRRTLSGAANVQFLLPLVVLALAPSAIAREKEEGALDMLFMAGFRSLDIYTAKLVGAIAPVVMLILLPMPLFTMCGAWGLCSPGYEILRQVLIIVFTVALGAIGLLMSSLCRRAGAASLMTLLAVAAWTLGFAYVSRRFFWAWPLAYFNGITALVMGAGMSRGASAAYGFAWEAVGSIAFHVLLIAVLAYITVKRLPRLVYAERPVRKRRLRRRRSPVRMGRFLAPPAAYALASMSGTGNALRRLRAVWVFVLSTTLVACVAPWLLLPLLLLFCYDNAASARDAAQDGGALSEVLLMPVDDRQAARHFLNAYSWAGLAYVPAFFTGLAVASSRVLDWRDPVLWIVGIVTVLAAVRCAALCGLNLALQGARPVMAALAAGLAVIEVGGLFTMFAGVIAKAGLATSDAASYRIAALGALVGFGLLAVWYYPRYARNFRAAVFEPLKVKKRNW